MKPPLLSRIIHRLADLNTARHTRRSLDRLSDHQRRDIGLPPFGPAPRNPFTEGW